MLKLVQSFLTFLKNLLVARRNSLLFLLLGVYLPLQVFGLLAWEIWGKEGGFLWDDTILLRLHATAQPQWEAFASALTKFGVYWGVVPITTVTAIALLTLRQWRTLAFLITTQTGSIIINRTAKMLMHRVRPSLWDSPAPELSYAFPSGHAMSSMTLVAALVILTWGSRWCWLVLSVGSLYVLSIAWTRLYLGVHYPTDILAGWLASIAWTIGVSMLINPRSPKQTTVPELTVNEDSSTVV